MRITISIFLLTILGLSACKKDDPETPTPTIKYDIIGSVNLYDEGTTSVSDSGMLVTVVGSNPAITAITDNDGDFNLSEVTSGTYTLTFEKANYGTFKRFNVDHTSNTHTIITQNPSLGMESTTSVSQLTTNISNDTVILNTTLVQNASISNPKYVRVFMGKNSDLSAQKYDAYSPAYVKQINPFTIKYSRTDLVDMGFQTGETVYVNVVGESFFANDYDDPNLNYRVFPNIFWKATTTSFIVP